jgi:hypothetical protein
MRQVMVRYRVKAGREDENEALVRAVYEELERVQPEGFRYATFRFDERSFAHIALMEGDTAPLPGLAAFKEFTRDIDERCDEPPVVSELRTVGSYRLSV